jgi:AraC-like DNA-binding protein
MLMELAHSQRGTADPAAEIIYSERNWLDASDGAAVDHPASRILVSRWTGNATSRCEHVSDVDTNYHVLGIALRPMPDLTVFADGKLIQSGHLLQGTMRFHPPGLPLRGIFRGQYDILHLHVPNAAIAEHLEGCDQKRTSSTMTDHAIVDPVIERLARALIHAETLGGIFGQSYADGINLAITAQLFGGRSDAANARVSGLAKWRLKRAIDFMMENLAEPIGLAEIATAAGLSRMHFAAQFRVTTGLPPHDYIQRRRIERAQELLANSDLPLVEIGLDVGFKNQSHFTTVFSRLVGQTPNVWRHSNSCGSKGTGVIVDFGPRGVPAAQRRANPLTK